MPTLAASDPILVEVVRGAMVESVHRGRVAITAPDGSLAAAVGQVSAPMYPRSASKPLQAVGMVRAGFDLADQLLAVVCASHSGEPFHTAAVATILARSGLDDLALQTPPDWPLDDLAKQELIRAGGRPSRIAMNCSGKHAGMLRTTVLNEGDISRYREVGHPTQRAILAAIADLAAERPGEPTVDGCGAPLYPLTLVGLARAFGRLSTSSDPAEARIAAVIRAFPEYVSGSRRDELDLHHAVPGLIGKAGAEAVYAVGLPDGRGVAVKIADGSTRARAVAMASVLQGLGFSHPTVAAQASQPVLGHGERVGDVRPRARTLSRLTR